jgi:hypothetical protein
MFSAIATLLLASPALAEDKQPIEKPKPNTLTAKEIADGWLLLFDGETTFGWKAQGFKEGEKAPDVQVKDGALLLGGAGGLVRFQTQFNLLELRGEYRTTSKDTGFAPVITGPQIRSGFVQEFKPTGAEEWRSFSASHTQDGFFVGVGQETPRKAFGEKDYDPSHRVEPVFRLQNSEQRLELRNVKLRPLNTKPLFAGKNLDGWKINAADPKRMLSKWEVTKDGELSLKNGPGDLVTEKEFDNFVLQLECKTLGDGLNSGVFFRCIPGQYQNGYEAQINNAILDKDRSKPKDAGTGAIYRRIASRKVVSNDNEWFTMTVVADGKHIATWVNGYQTVDWIDDRKEDENPRKGFRAAKGPISLQGHDPTTDILFRNIRIAELPAK